MKKNRILLYIGLAMVFIQAIVSVAAIYRIKKFDVLPNKKLILVLLCIIAAELVVTGLMLFGKTRIPGCILSLILIVALAYGTFLASKAQKVIENDIGASETTQVVMEVIVLNSSSKTSLDMVAGDVVGICKTDENYENSIRVAQMISAAAGGVDITTAEYEDDYSMTKALVDGNIGALIISSSRKHMIDDIYQTMSTDEEGFLGLNEAGVPLAFSDVSKIVEQYNLEVLTTEYNKKNEEPEEIPKEIIDVSMQPFVVYMSGLDREGDISSLSRSDVNLIVCVNPQTKQIAAITTPRDSFVKIPGKTDNTELYDKLTHAGIYGPNCKYSMAALSWLYGIDFNFYLKVNYSSMEQIINAIGGVDVYSRYTFDSKNILGFHYEQGTNHLNGFETLVFCRERYSFPDGDYERGRNHIEVFKAVLNAVLKPENLTKYSELLDIAAENIETNISAEEITKLVKMQLGDGASWNVLKYSTSGINGGAQQLRYTLAAPKTKLYVTILDEGSVQGACLLMEKVLNGEIMTQEEVDTLAASSIRQ